MRLRHEIELDIGKRGVVGRPCSRAEVGGDMPDVAIRPCGGGGIGWERQIVRMMDLDNKRSKGSLAQLHAAIADGYNHNDPSPLFTPVYRLLRLSPFGSLFYFPPVLPSLLLNLNVVELVSRFDLLDSLLYIFIFCSVQLTTRDADDPFSRFHSLCVYLAPPLGIDTPCVVV